jgi:hypothetical protein
MHGRHSRWSVPIGRLSASISKDLFPTLFLGGIVLLLFTPYLGRPQGLIWPRSGLGSDAVHAYWVDYLILARAVADGHLPLWDGLVVVGHPVSGELGALWLYPFAFVYLVFPPTFAFALLNALHVFLAGVFTYFLIRALFRVTRVSATFGALVFMLMPHQIAHLAGGHLVNICGAAWMPAVLLGAWGAVRARRLWPAALGGGALALQLLTHPQVPIGTFYLLIGMLGWYCWRALARAGWRGAEFLDAVRRSVVVGSIVGGVAAVVAAARWLPIMELFPWTVRIEFDLSVPFWYQLPPAMLLSLLVPTAFQFPEWTIYVGIVPLFLALVALMGERRRVASFLWIAVVVILILTLGDATPIYGLARWLVPGLGYFRTRTRLWFLGGFVIALLGGLGVDTLCSREAWRRANRNRRWLNLVGVAYLLGGAMGVAGLGILTRQLPVEATVAVGAGTLSLAVLYSWRRRPTACRLQQISLLVVLLLDLLPLDAGFMMGIDPRETFLKPDPVVDFVGSQSGDYRVYSPHHNLSYALSAECGIESIDGYLGLQLAHAVEIVKIASGCRLQGYAGGVPPCLSGEIDPQAYLTAEPDPAILGLLNVRYVVADFPLDVPDLEPVLVDGETTVYENRQFLPRAFLVEDVRTVPTRADAFEQLPTVDVAHTVLIESDVMPTALSGGPVDGGVIIESRRAGRMTLTVQSSREALLLYSEAWAPGWHATVDGGPVQVVRVDGALLGVVVPAGSSQVIFNYYPLGWQVGWPISLVAIVALAGWAGLNCVRRRRLWIVKVGGSEDSVCGRRSPSIH